GAIGFQLLDQRCEMGKPTDRTVSARRMRIVDASECVRIAAPAWNGKALEQRFPNQMRWSPRRIAHADIAVRLAEIIGQQLRVAVREVQQVDVAKARLRVERFRVTGVPG